MQGACIMRSFLLLCTFRVVDAHGHMIYPTIRPAIWADGPANQIAAPFQQFNFPYERFFPASHNNHQHAATDFRCHGFRAVAPQTALQAGTNQRVQWNLGAAHPGDCSVYLSYEASDAPRSWIKLADFPGCGDHSWRQSASNAGPPEGVNTNYVTLPTWLPSCNHCVLRWEWMAVHHPESPQQYATCADVSIQGTSESHASFMQRVSPVVRSLPLSLPSHAPNHSTLLPVQ